MANSMISPLRLAGSRLTSTTAGRAIATNSVNNARALQETEHEAVRQHLEAMGHHHLEYRQPMLFRSSPINTQRVLQQDSQSGLHFQSIRSISTSQNHQASMTSQSVMSDEADEDIMREVMDQTSHRVSALHQTKGSLITKQRSLLLQNPQSHLDSQFESIRSFSTSQRHQASMTSQSVMSEEADDDIHRLHREAMDQRSHQVSALHQVKGSLITKQRTLQRQTPQSQLNSQFQSVRSLHTNVRMPEFMDETSESQEIMSLHNDTIESRQQQMQKIYQVRGSLINNKSPVQKQQPQFQSVRSLHTNIRISDFIGEVSEDHAIVDLHSEAIKQRQQQMQELSQIRTSLITLKIDAKRVKDNVAVFE